MRGKHGGNDKNLQYIPLYNLLPYGLGPSLTRGWPGANPWLGGRLNGGGAGDGAKLPGRDGG